MLNFDIARNTVATLVQSFPRRLLFGCITGTALAATHYVAKSSSLVAILPNLILETSSPLFGLAVTCKIMTEFSIVTLLSLEEHPYLESIRQTPGQWTQVASKVISLAVASLVLTGSCSITGIGVFIICNFAVRRLASEIQLLTLSNRVRIQIHDKIHNNYYLSMLNRHFKDIAHSIRPSSD